MLMHKDLHKTDLAIGEFYILFESRCNISLFMPIILVTMGTDKFKI